MEYSRGEYLAYLQTARWRHFRAVVLRRAGYRCTRCGGTSDDGSLDVHHLTYTRLGHERPSDVEVLCRECHEGADDQRRWTNRTRAWARKVYGEHWYRTYTFEEIEQRFGAWLERKGLA